MRFARVSQIKTLDDFDFSYHKSLKHDRMMRLGQLDFLRENKNDIFLEPPGTGKTLSSWVEIFGDPIAVAAHTDRLVHHAEVSAMEGESYRRRSVPGSGPKDSSANHGAGAR